MDSKTPASGLSLDVEQIKKLLPHRAPFLFIEKLTEIKPGESAVGYKSVSINEPHFQGHFPGNPVFPGVLMIEGMAQTAGVLCMANLKLDQPKSVFFMTIDKAKFRRPVVPGDTLEYHMEKIAQRKTMWWYHGLAKVAGHVVAEAEVGAAISAT